MIVIEITESLANCLMDDKVLSEKKNPLFPSSTVLQLSAQQPRVLDGQKYQAVNKQ